jgi:hypothetical protein
LIAAEISLFVSGNGENVILYLLVSYIDVNEDGIKVKIIPAKM